MPKRPSAWNRFLRSIFIAPAGKKGPKRRLARREHLESRMLLTASISVSSPSVSESEGTQLSFTITASDLTPYSQVSYSTSDGTAIAGTDYDSQFGTFSVDDTGSGTDVVTVNTHDDNATGEGNETFTLTATGGGASGSGTGTIPEDDDTGSGGPTITVTSPSVSESEGAQLSFTITAANLTPYAQVSYGTSDGSAIAGTDYDSQFGSFYVDGTGSGGDVVTVNTHDDNAAGEGNETFTLIAGDSEDGASGSGTGTIYEDDDYGEGPTITVTSPSVSESEGAQLNFTITASNLTPYSEVDYSTNNATAKAGTDYDSQSGSFYVDGMGDGSDVVSVNTHDDNGSGEENETLQLTASGGSVSGIGTGTILEDDDNAPTITVNSPSVTEGDLMAFTISASGLPANSTVDYGTSDGSAVAGTDYVGVSGSFSVNGAGYGSDNVDVTTLDDNGTGEGTQSFTLTANGGGASGSGTGTIHEDSDAQGTITVNNPTATEGSPLAFSITASGWDPNTQISYNTSGGTAISGIDYDSTSGSFLTGADGSGSATVNVTTLDDNGVDEEAETVGMSASANGVTGTGVGSIIEDDDGPCIGLSDASAAESSGQIVFPVTLSEAGAQTITVDYTTVDGAGPDGAVQGEDYTKTTGTLTFAPGVTQQSVTVPLLADAWHAGMKKGTLGMKSNSLVP